MGKRSRVFLCCLAVLFCAAFLVQGAETAAPWTGKAMLHLKLRKEPKWKAETLEVVPRDALVRVDKAQDDWLLVWYKGPKGELAGWVPADYVLREGAAAPPKNAPVKDMPKSTPPKPAASEEKPAPVGEEDGAEEGMGISELVSAPEKETPAPARQTQAVKEREKQPASAPPANRGARHEKPGEKPPTAAPGGALTGAPEKAAGEQGQGAVPAVSGGTAIVEEPLERKKSLPSAPWWLPYASAGVAVLALCLALAALGRARRAEEELFQMRRDMDMMGPEDSGGVTEPGGKIRV
jgi:hypothetical protein